MCRSFWLKQAGRLLPAALLVAGMAGCQARNGALFHPYGVTRVPPPPTHSYSIPKSYYGTPGASPARQSKPSPGAVGSGVGSSRAVGGVTLEGMPVNDATRLVATPGTNASPAQPPVTSIPRAPGLQFIRRMSWTTPVSNRGSQSLSPHPVSNRSTAPTSSTVPAASSTRPGQTTVRPHAALKAPVVAQAGPLGAGVEPATWRRR